MSAEFNNHVPFTQGGKLRRTVRLDGKRQHAALNGQIVMADHAAVQLHVLAGQADVTARDFALFDEPAGDVFRRVDRDGKTNSLRRQDYRRVDADNFTARIDQRPAGISRVQRGVGLDDVVDKPAGARPEGASEGTDNARRHGALEAIGVADGDGELADAQSRRIAEAHWLEVGRVDANDREVGFRIVADQVRVGPAAIGEHHFNSVSPVNDVTVGENEPVRGDYETGTAAAPFARLTV